MPAEQSYDVVLGLQFFMFEVDVWKLFQLLLRSLIHCSVVLHYSAPI